MGRAGAGKYTDQGERESERKSICIVSNDETSETEVKRIKKE